MSSVLEIIGKTAFLAIIFGGVLFLTYHSNIPSTSTSMDGTCPGGVSPSGVEYEFQAAFGNKSWFESSPGDWLALLEAVATNRATGNANWDGWTPLHQAALEGGTDRVRQLLDDGAGVNARDQNGWTPLFWAAGYGYAEVARVLLDAHTSVNEQDFNGNTPLHLAASGFSQGHADIVGALLATGVRGDARNNDGTTPLHLAAGYRNADIVRALLATDVSVDVQDKGGNTPLHLAIACEYSDIVRILLDAGAEDLRE